MTDEPRTIAVRTEVVLDVLVRGLHEQAVATSGGAAPAALDESPHPALARTGYFARVAETERFDAARAPAPWLADRLAGRDPVELARELADGEPLDRPDPGHSTSASWRIPGPGGHVRHYVALRSAGRAAGDELRLQLKRSWMFGFYLRCCEEAAGGPGDSRP